MSRDDGKPDGKKIIVIGLDGASFNYLKPLMNKGVLPNLSKVFEHGVHSDCISTIPPLTPPAWSTMLTGVNPGKHGIFDFIQPDPDGAFRMVDAGKRMRKTFLNRARENGIRTIDLLVPYTFPPEPHESGISVSGLGTPSWESDFIRPHDIRDRLLETFPFLKITDPTTGHSVETLHKVLADLTGGAADLARFAMRKVDEWGMLFTVFQATDLVPHFYSKFFDPGHPDYDPDAPDEYRESLQNVYRIIDEFCGDCLDVIKKSGGWIVLVSDHGSQPLMGAIGKDAFITKWLIDKGYMKTRSGGQGARSASVRAGSLANRLVYLAKKYTPHGFRNMVNRMMGKRKEDIESRLTAVPFMQDIDWSDTKAFCAPGGYGVGIYINREGDFPGGVVSKGAEYHRLRDEIKNGLRSLEITSGIPLFTHVFPREEALWGPAVELAPDLLILWKETQLLRERNFTLTDGTTMEPPGKKEGSRLTWCGTHSMRGIFAITGEGVIEGERLPEPCSLADIYPVIMTLAGLEIPSDIDGEFLSQAFTDEFLDNNPPRKGPPEPGGKREGVETSDEDTEKLLDLLTGLGYLN